MNILLRLLCTICLTTVACSLTMACVFNDTTLVKQTAAYHADLTELTDRQYPNNPDKKYRSNNYSKVDYNEVVFNEVFKGVYDIDLLPSDDNFPTVSLKRINIMEYIPTIPDFVKEDEYLSLVSVVNQEWNRNQITFRNNHFKLEPGKKAHKHRISRVDIARSCLNSYLWEVYFYTYNTIWGKHELMYHGWFNFPEELYQELFQKRNEVAFDKYAEHLEEWKDLPQGTIDFDKLRTVTSKKNVAFEELNDEMYPLEGERKKKADEIIYPRNARRMSDFHTDKAKFSSFVQPGMYVKKEKRLTQLSRFEKLDKVVWSKTINGEFDTQLDELELNFSNNAGQYTILKIGGINFQEAPIVLEERANEGDLYPMGIGNHTFYENYSEQQAYSSKNNPFYGILTNEKGEWLDSHAVGIDGPIIHRDSKDQNLLHIWLLSYERHALVGHYKIRMK